MNKEQPYIELALSMGAADAVYFRIDDIVFDSRTLLKCLYSCPYGPRYTCPTAPGSPTMAQFQEMLSRYSWGVLVHGRRKKETMDIAFELERRAFVDGYHMAWSLSGCPSCPSGCTLAQGTPCRFPRRARPQFYSVGIDVFATVRGLGLPIRTLKDPDTEEQNWYAPVFME
ncbi:MAG: DUF2284 domain-containing protein [Firmicutes bacterium]|nr:DUF2284 domain-containing protein [Bacillota bacterium]